MSAREEKEPGKRRERGGRSSVPANHEEFGQTSAARQTMAVSDWREKRKWVWPTSVQVNGQKKKITTNRENNSPSERRPERTRQVYHS